MSDNKDNKKKGFFSNLFSSFGSSKQSKEEESLLNKMNSDGWELFFIHNEPLHEYPGMLVKFYFRKKKLSFLEQFFDFG